MAKQQSEEPIVVHDSQGFLSGILLGAMLAGGAYFFLYTEKGKKLAKRLFQMGKEELEVLRRGEYQFPDVIAEKASELGIDLHDFADKAIDYFNKGYDHLRESSEIVSKKLPDISNQAKTVLNQVSTVAPELAAQVGVTVKQALSKRKESVNTKITKKSKSKTSASKPKVRFKRISKVKPKFFVKKGKSLGK